MVIHPSDKGTKCVRWLKHASIWNRIEFLCARRSIILLNTINHMLPCARHLTKAKKSSQALLFGYFYLCRIVYSSSHWKSSTIAVIKQCSSSQKAVMNDAQCSMMCSFVHNQIIAKWKRINCVLEKSSSWMNVTHFLRHSKRLSAASIRFNSYSNRFDLLFIELRAIFQPLFVRSVFGSSQSLRCLHL